MRRFVFLFAFVWGSIACNAQDSIRPLRTEAEWALVRARVAQGRVTAAAFGVNAPNDSAELVVLKNRFMESPFDTGATETLGQDIWTGWYYGMQPGTGVDVVVFGTKVRVEPQPSQHMLDAAGAATWARLTGDTAVANRVMEALDRQVAMPRSNVAQWANPARYRTPTTTVGAQEGVFYARIDNIVDAVLPWMSAGRKAAYVAWRKPSALYLAKRQHARFLNWLPLRYSYNTTSRVGIASATGERQFSEPIYEPVTDAYMNVYDGKYKYTHRNANGTLGNRVSRIGDMYDNVQACITLGYMPFGLQIANDSLVRIGTCYLQESVKFGQYRGGYSTEWKRNGRTAPFWKGSHASFGAYNYEYMNDLAYLYPADILLKRGDSSLIAYKTTEGAHGSESTTPKRYVDRLVLRAQGIVNEGPQHYYNVVSSGNRITHVNPSDLKSVGGQVWPYEAPFDYQLGLAERYYTRLTILRKAYQRKRGRNNATAGLVNYAWGGAQAIEPAMFSRAGLSAGIIAMPGTKRLQFSPEVVAATWGVKSWAFIPTITTAAKSYAWTRLAGTPRTARNRDGEPVLIIHNGSLPLPAATYRYELVARFADGQVERTIVEVRVPPPQ